MDLFTIACMHLESKRENLRPAFPLNRKPLALTEINLIGETLARWYPAGGIEFPAFLLVQQAEKRKREREEKFASSAARINPNLFFP